MQEEHIFEKAVGGYTEPPTPYLEENDPSPFWLPDLYDSAIPQQKGFLTDLVYFMRGMEVPTLFTLWSGLWLLSTVIKREAWLSWYPRVLYPNLYVILAGPAGCKKSVTIDEVGMPIIERIGKYIENVNIRRMKNIHVVKDKMTPEALLDAMLPANKPGKAAFAFVDENGDPLLDKHNRAIRYNATSEMGVVLSEMTSSIGKRSYTEGFVEILLDLYNPKDEWQWRTKGEGVKKFHRTYLTMLAATTPTAFKESVPKVAAGDGFLSRSVVVYQSKTNRRFSMPRRVEHGPTIEELSMRLAWIAENSLGEYHLSEDAFALYDSWYDDHKDYLEQNEFESGLRGRMDINLLKVAMLLRAQRYVQEPKNEITGDDMAEAINLVHMTYGMSAALLGELGDEVIGNGESVLRILDRHVSLTRTELMRKCKYKADELNPVLDYLVQTGNIMITRGGKQHSYPSKAGDEVYTLSKLYMEEKNKLNKYDPKEMKKHVKEKGKGKGNGRGEEVSRPPISIYANTLGENGGSVPEVQDCEGGSESARDQSRNAASGAERE